MKILVVDDEALLVKGIRFNLQSEGYEVITGTDGQEAVKLVQEQNPDLVVLDVMMPHMDGVQATMKIREEKNIPIIMLSAKSEDYDKIIGLNVGADDYVTKPFNPLELMARVKSQLRRYTRLGSMSAAQMSGVYQSGGLSVDDNEKRVTVDGEEVPVTPIEFGILKLLTEHAGRVFSMDQIYEAVWQEPAYNPENTVAVHIRRIREKIEIDPKNPKYLKVVWGIGYKIEKF